MSLNEKNRLRDIIIMYIKILSDKHNPVKGSVRESHLYFLDEYRKRYNKLNSSL